MRKMKHGVPDDDVYGNTRNASGIWRKFVDDLIDQNGVSTRVWVKEHGADYVRRFFHEIFFGV